MKAMPIRYKRVDDTSKLKRHVFCTHYGDCLDYAIERSWEGFSCEQCEAFEDERPEVDLWLEEQSRWMSVIFSGAIAEIQSVLEQRRT